MSAEERHKRIADYLQTDPTIDKTRLIITGASRYGKSSMVAAALDDRLMGAPVVTGGGGVGAYRFAGPRRSETLDAMQIEQETCPRWDARYGGQWVWGYYRQRHLENYGEYFAPDVIPGWDNSPTPRKDWAP